MNALAAFLSGAITAGFLIASLFFLSFWRRTRDSLFAAFAAAFLLLAVNQALITLAGIPEEHRSWVYLLRLAAFALLIVAIVRKNIAGRPFRRK
jgi:zinc transporter ZupT